MGIEHVVSNILDDIPGVDNVLALEAGPAHGQAQKELALHVRGDQVDAAIIVHISQQAFRCRIFTLKQKPVINQETSRLRQWVRAWV